jgi:hypothetical protein
MGFKGWLIRGLLMASGWVALGASAAEEGAAHNRNYSFIYFENGYPTRLFGQRRAQAHANLAARESPDLVVQTGFYSLKLGCDDLQLSGYDALPGSDYLAALNQDVTVFSPAKLKLVFEKDGVRYVCTSGIVQDKVGDYVRLIESGQFVQRFDHLGLVFTGKNGEVLEKIGRLEITAWADHVAFTLDLSDVAGVSQVGIQLVSPAGKIHRAVTKSDRAVLALQPHLDRAYEPLDASACIAEAVNFKTNKRLKYHFDDLEYGFNIQLPIDQVRFPADRERVDEFLIEVRNPSNTAQNIPLIFDELQARAITGTSMVLCDAKDGRPLGIPVQISKNWHREKDKRVLYEGSWLRGYTMVPLQAGETKRFRLRVIFGYWADVPAVSYAQLCLIGYGGNWKWDESALGCWGESMCYDYSQHLGSSVITDVRPAFTPDMQHGKPHGWTENVGGGDFLIYCDQNNVFRWGKRLKTAYHWTGPNMTEVFYSGVTDDDAIRFNYRVRSVRTGDYHRRFHAYAYKFLKAVNAPERLVFHQMAADYYNSVTYENYYVGDESGLKATGVSQAQLRGYADEAIPFENRWLAINDMQTGEGEAKARRGILAMYSALNGKPFTPYLHLYNPRGREGKQSFDLSSESVSRSYAAGDVVTGELSFVMPAKSADDYWGDDKEFADRLSAIGPNAWRAVADEYQHNIKLNLTAHKGRLLKNYPVEIQADPMGAVLADVTIERGGIGHLPIILRGVPGERALRLERQLDGKWIPLESADSGQNNYYQGVLNAQGEMDCAFNVARPSADLNASWRIRIRTTSN